MYVPLLSNWVNVKAKTDAVGCKAYFILSASASVPLLYYVDRLREGRSYSTRSVRAVQEGRTIFVMLCSFQIPETWQPSRHWPMPKAPPPEDCEDEAIYYRRIANQPNVTKEFRARILGYVKVRYFVLEHLFSGSLSGRCLSHERRAQSLSDLQASSQTSPRDGRRTCIG